MRFVITVLGIGSILIFNLFPNRPLLPIYGLHYSVKMGLVLLLTWSSSFFIELHPDTYRDIFLNFTPINFLLAAGFFIFGWYRKRKKPASMRIINFFFISYHGTKKRVINRS